MPLSYGEAYGVGTISVVQGSLNVVGVGTIWSGQGIFDGDSFGAGGFRVSITTLVDSTHLTLAYLWPGPTLTNQPYSIRADAAIRHAPTQLADEVRAFVDRLSQMTVTGLVALSQYKGQYSGSTIYEFLNIVTNQGISWVYINEDSGFGNAPPTLPAGPILHWHGGPTAVSATSNAHWQPIPNVSTESVLDALGVHAITISTENPSGGVNGDLWFRVPA